jgi:hypothetical protein
MLALSQHPTKHSSADLAFMEGLSLDLPLLLKPIHDILVSPAHFVRQTLKKNEDSPLMQWRRSYLYCAVFPTRFQPQHPQCFWHHHPLLAVVRRWNTFIKLETLKSCCTTSSLVRCHATDGSEEDFGRRSVMEGARLFGVDDMTLVEEVVVPELKKR